MAPRERIPERPTEATLKRWQKHHQRRSRQYIPTIPLEWLRPTFGMKPATTRTALAIWYRAKCNGSGAVAVGPKLLEKFGVGARGGRNAIAELEAAGLIQVDRQPGKAPRITILEVGKA